MRINKDQILEVLHTLQDHEEIRAHVARTEMNEARERSEDIEKVIKIIEQG